MPAFELDDLGRARPDASCSSSSSPPKGFARKLVAEMWLYPDLTGEQQTETRRALEFFSARLEK